jgi:CRISPR system Cascade subunit CasA
MTVSDASERFNLVDHFWLPVTDLEGNAHLVSLQEALCSPQKYRGLNSANPVEFFALWRTLLAICHRAIGPGNFEQRLLLSDTWPSQKIREYLSTWHARFDLFDPARPFMQVPGLATASLEPKAWTQIALDRSSGNTKLLFDHSLDEAPGEIEAPDATRLLLGHLQFTPGGLVKALRISGTRGAACALQVVLPMGETLQETLALGLIPQSAEDHARDLPPWESEPPSLEVLRSPPALVAQGPAQRYTWLSRAVLLLPNAHGRVSNLLYAEGLSLIEDPVPDPMVALVPSKEAAQPVVLDVDRAFWRDLHALTGESGSTPPRVVEHAISLRAAVDDYEPIGLAAGGLLPDQAKIVLWRLEERRVSPAVLRTVGGAARVDAATRRAQEVSQAMFGVFMDLCRNWIQQTGDRTPAEADVKNLLRQLNGISSYWVELEPCFWRFVSELGRGEAPDKCLQDWYEDIRSACETAWRGALTLLGTDGRALAAQAQSVGKLRLAQRKAVQP